jgi:hypothetical protein
MSKKKRTSRKPYLVVCLRNDGYPASLEPRKIYRALPDVRAALLKRVRVIDESGEDYLYPEAYFAAISLPVTIERALGESGVTAERELGGRARASMAPKLSPRQARPTKTS